MTERAPGPDADAGADHAPDAEPGGRTSPGAPGQDACNACLERTWLIGRLAGWLEVRRGRALELLELGDDELVAALNAGRDLELRRGRLAFDPEAARVAARRAGLETICVCRDRYPACLLALPAPPAVLHVAGGLERFLQATGGDLVAVVGARRASDYGREVGRSLGAGLAAAGVTVVSGMARGIDTAAHEGTLQGGGVTVAVLPGSAHRPYPPSSRRLHTGIVSAGCAVSEFAPGMEVRRWGFRARNRIIAALGTMTIVVEAGVRSGSLVTAVLARELGRAVGAVPGRVTTEPAAGPNALLADGALVVRGVQDVLDHLFGAGVRVAAIDRRPRPTARQRAVLEALAEGAGTAAALARAGVGTEAALAVLAELELVGWIRRGPGGAFRVLP